MTALRRVTAYVDGRHADMLEARAVAERRSFSFVVRELLDREFGPAHVDAPASSSDAPAPQDG